MKSIAFLIAGIGIGAILSYGIWLLVYTQWSPKPYTIEQVGSFGDAFAGILNPLLTIINIGVLIYISFKVAEFNNNVTLKIASRQFKMTSLYQAKHDVLKLISVWKDDNRNEDKFFDMYHRFYALWFLFELEKKDLPMSGLASRTLLDMQHDLKSPYISGDAWPYKADDFESKFIKMISELELEMK